MGEYIFGVNIGVYILVDFQNSLYRLRLCVCVCKVVLGYKTCLYVSGRRRRGGGKKKDEGSRKIRKRMKIM